MFPKLTHSIAALVAASTSHSLSSGAGDAKSLTKIQEEYASVFEKAIDTVGKYFGLSTAHLRAEARSMTERTYEDIAEIFTPVNSAGTKIGNLDMLMSFSPRRLT